MTTAIGSAMIEPRRLARAVCLEVERLGPGQRFVVAGSCQLLVVNPCDQSLPLQGDRDGERTDSAFFTGVSLNAFPDSPRPQLSAAPNA